MTPVIMIETSRTTCFVSPAYCEHLIQAGVCGKVPYQWHIYSGVSKLQTRVFDHLDIYKDSDSAVNLVWPPEQIIPAFSIGDVEKLLPRGFLLTLNDNAEYEISLPNMYDLESCVAERMPDVFAMLVLKSIQHRVLDIRRINSILSK